MCKGNVSPHSILVFEVPSAFWTGVGCNLWHCLNSSVFSLLWIFFAINVLMSTLSNCSAKWLTTWFSRARLSEHTSGHLGHLKHFEWEYMDQDGYTMRMKINIYGGDVGRPGSICLRRGDPSRVRSIIGLRLWITIDRLVFVSIWVAISHHHLPCFPFCFLFLWVCPFLAESGGDPSLGGVVAVDTSPLLTAPWYFLLSEWWNRNPKSTDKPTPVHCTLPFSAVAFNIWNNKSFMSQPALIRLRRFKYGS